MTHRGASKTRTLWVSSHRMGPVTVPRARASGNRQLLWDPTPEMSLGQQDKCGVLKGTRSAAWAAGHEPAARILEIMSN